MCVVCQNVIVSMSEKREATNFNVWPSTTFNCFLLLCMYTRVTSTSSLIQHNREKYAHTQLEQRVYLTTSFCVIFSVLLKFNLPGGIRSLRAPRQYPFCPTKVNILATMIVWLQLYYILVILLCKSIKKRREEFVVTQLLCKNKRTNQNHFHSPREETKCRHYF